MTKKEEGQKERMAEYERRRQAALKAIKAARGKSNPDALPLMEVVELLPDHPEWNQYRAKKRKKGK